MASFLGPPSVIRSSMAAPDVVRSGCATREDWNRHRVLIGQLYEKRPLVKVIEIMAEQHGFRATTKMYKTHITQWDLDKKNQEQEMRAIVRKTEQLNSQGKAATFRARGRSVDYKNVVRYGERKGLSIDDVVTQRSNSKTPEAVKCFTSPSSPLMTPESMAIPERILTVIRDYFTGSFENGTWFTEDPRIMCQTKKIQGDRYDFIYSLGDQCTTACDLFTAKRVQEAG